MKRPLTKFDALILARVALKAIDDEQPNDVEILHTKLERVLRLLESVIE